MIIQDPYLVSEEHANLLWEKFEDSNCKNYDVIVVADTITAGGRPFIQGLLNVLKEARSRTISSAVAKQSVTNRPALGGTGSKF